MAYFVGALVELSTDVTDLDGAAANATVVLTVTDPAGATTTPTVTHGGTGEYSATFTVTAAGEWLWAWAASGAVVAQDAGQLTVLTPRVLVAGMEEFKQQLNRLDEDTDDDNALYDYLVSATEAVEELTSSAIGVQTFTEYHHAAGGIIAPNRHPIVSVTSITPDSPGAGAIDSSLYTVDSDGGAIYLDTPTRARLRLIYRAGQAPIPARYRRAGLIIAQHLWMVENGGAGAPHPSDTTLVAGAGFAIPNRAVELLGASDMLPGIA